MPLIMLIVPFVEQLPADYASLVKFFETGDGTITVTSLFILAAWIFSAVVTCHDRPKGPIMCLLTASGVPGFTLAVLTVTLNG